MPVVQKYGAEKVDLAPLPGVRKTAAETPASEGAGVAAARAGRWDAVARLGATGEQASLTAFQTITQNARDQADEAARLGWQNQLAGFENDTIYNPDTGVLTVKGQDAMGLPERVDDAYNKLADSIAQGLATPRQKEQFARDRQARQQSIATAVLRHTDEQIQTFHAQELDATVKNGLDLAIKKAQDPAGAADELNRAAAALQQSGPKLFGWGPEELKKHVQDLYSAGHTGIIENLLTNHKTAAAKLYYEEAKDSINGDQRTRIEAALQTAGTAQQGLDAATEIWKQLGPKPDDPLDKNVKIEEMEQLALDKFKDDPNAYDATVKYLREHMGAFNAGRQDRAESLAGPVWIAASTGATLDQVQHMREFMALPGRQQAAVSDYIVSKAEHKAALAASAESQAYYRESRLYTEAQRLDAEKTKAGWARYWDLASNPAGLDKMSVNALQMLRGELGDDHVNRLLQQKLTLGNKDEQVRAATIDDDLFKTIAVRNGINAYGTLSDDQKATLGQLKNVIESEIDVAQQHKGKLLTREEKQTLMQSIVDQKVYLSHWYNALGLGGNDEHIAATLKPEERAQAYIPIAKIPQGALGEYVNYIRSLSPETQRLSDADLRSRFTARIQKAYALRLLGASRAELEAVLQGRQ